MCVFWLKYEGWWFSEEIPFPIFGYFNLGSPLCLILQSFHFAVLLRYLNGDLGGNDTVSNTVSNIFSYYYAYPGVSDSSSLWIHVLLPVH